MPLRFKIFLAIFIITLCISASFSAFAEEINVEVVGFDDGIKTNKKSDYDEAVADAKRKAIERSGAKISSKTIVNNFNIKDDTIIIGSKGFLLPGFKIIDNGYTHDNIYSVTLIGKVKIGENEIQNNASCYYEGYEFYLLMDGNRAIENIIEILKHSEFEIKNIICDDEKFFISIENKIQYFDSKFEELICIEINQKGFISHLFTSKIYTGKRTSYFGFLLEKTFSAIDSIDEYTIKLGQPKINKSNNANKKIIWADETFTVKLESYLKNEEALQTIELSLNEKEANCIYVFDKSSMKVIMLLDAFNNRKQIKYQHDINHDEQHPTSNVINNGIRIIDLGPAYSYTKDKCEDSLCTNLFAEINNKIKEKTDFSLYLDKGNLEYELGNYAEAEESFSMAFLFGYSPYIHRGKSRLELKKFESALSDLENEMRSESPSYIKQEAAYYAIYALMNKNKIYRFEILSLLDYIYSIGDIKTFNPQLQDILGQIIFSFPSLTDGNSSDKEKYYTDGCLLLKMACKKGYCDGYEYEKNTYARCEY